MAGVTPWAPTRRWPPAPPEPPTLTWDAELPMAPQALAWTCSACALDWCLRATRLDPISTREKCVFEIGYPENINEQYGLMDSSGSALRAVYSSWGQRTGQGWLDFAETWTKALQTTGQLSGAAWNHWVAIRGTRDGALWIANSAPGYMSVYDVLSAQDFMRLGPFSVVWLEA